MNINQEVAALKRTSGRNLRKKFAQICGYATDKRSRTWLIRRIAWRLQANAEGGLSERALARAAELAKDARLRATSPRVQQSAQDAREWPTVAQVAIAADPRLPMPGAVIVRDYKGRRLEVKVLEHGLEFEGKLFKSISAVAEQVTGSHCNGYLFFRLQGGGQ